MKPTELIENLVENLKNASMLIPSYNKTAKRNIKAAIEQGERWLECQGETTKPAAE